MFLYIGVFYTYTWHRVQQDVERDKSDRSGTVEGGLDLEEGL